MDLTEIKQTCSAITIDGSLKYRVGMDVISAGELPHKYIFVYTIQDADNPATDTFTRVGNVEDIQGGQQSRDAAIDAEVTEYLSISAEFYYKAINSAVDAKSALETRINELINTWVVYQDGFIDTDELVLSYPTTDPGYEQALKDAYADACVVREAAEVETTAADVTLTETEAALVYEKQIYTIYQSTCTLITKVWMNSSTGELPTYRSKIETGGGDEGTEAQTYWGTLQASMEALKNAVCPNVPTQAGVVSGAEDAVSSALSAKEEASVSLASAQAAEDEALAAVLAVCPSFDPGTV